MEKDVIEEVRLERLRGHVREEEEEAGSAASPR